MMGQPMPARHGAGAGAAATPPTAPAPDAAKQLAAVKKLFGSHLSDDVAAQLVGLCQLFRVTPDHLHTKWAARDDSAPGEDGVVPVPGADAMEALTQQLQRDQEQQSALGLVQRHAAAAGRGAAAVGPLHLRPDDGADRLMHDRHTIGTPSPAKRRLQLRNAPSHVSPMRDLASPRRAAVASPASASASAAASAAASAHDRLVPPITGTFATRDRSKAAFAIYHPEIPAAPAYPTTPAVMDLSLIPDQQREGYRYMFENLTERGDWIDAQHEMMQARIADALNDDAEPDGEAEAGTTETAKTTAQTKKAAFALGNPAQSSQEPILAVGRIFCDALAQDAKLNPKSLVLETSRALGSGQRVPLDMGPLATRGTGYAVFPGQFVGVEGSNPSGKQFCVTRLIDPPLAPRTNISVQNLMEMYAPVAADGSPLPNAAQPMKLLVAMGPYTLDRDLLYEPLEALVTEVVAQHQPDILLLQGPFVDAKHPLVAQGQVHVDLDTLFREQIGARLTRLLAAKPGMKLVLVPSVRDACTEWCVFPQPPLASVLKRSRAAQRRAELGIPPEAALFPNPVQFTINDALIAVSNNDILMHLSAEELAVQPTTAPGARLPRLFRHVLAQRAFYPLFPPASRTDANLDLARLEAVTLQATPDLLVLGSQLVPVATEVAGCLCLNPGSVAKPAAGGTYQLVTVYPPDIKQLQQLHDAHPDEEILLNHDVAARTRVETFYV